MGKCLYILGVCSLLLSCNHGAEPEELCELFEHSGLICGCMDEWPLVEMTCRFESVWDYPVKPGTEEWTFQTIDEMINACQIPEIILSSLSTEELTIICLQHPLLLTMLTSNCYTSSFDKWSNEINGLRELYKREDAAMELLKCYQCAMQKRFFMSPLKNSGWEYGLLYHTSFVSYLQILLSRFQSHDNQVEILRHLVAGYEKQMACSASVYGSWIRINLYARAHIINRISPQSLDVTDPYIVGFMCNGFCDQALENIINELSYQLIINQNK